jgi:hypothetical protein
MATRARPHLAASQQRDGRLTHKKITAYSVASLITAVALFQLLLLLCKLEQYFRFVDRLFATWYRSERRRDDYCIVARREYKWDAAIHKSAGYGIGQLVSKIEV